MVSSRPISIAIAASPSSHCTPSCSASVRAEALALADIGAGDLQRALGQAEPAHAMGQPRRCRGGSASPSARRRRPSAGSRRGSPARRSRSSQWPPCSSGPMIGMRRTISQPGWSRSNRKAVRPRARIVGGARDQDEVLRHAGAGDEPLVARRSPSGRRVASARGADHADGSEPAPGIGSVMAKAERTLAVDDRLQPALLLRRRADLGQQRSCCRRRARRS